MSTVNEEDESMRKIILPESYSFTKLSNNLSSTSTSQPLDKVARSCDIGVANGSADTSDTHFDLLNNDEEERLLDDLQELHITNVERRIGAAGDPRSSIIGTRHVATAPSLQSTSLIKGRTSNIAKDFVCHSSSTATVPILHSGSTPSKISLTPNELKKPKKEVSEYYKKQNELLENFKNDSEQIQVFKRARTRQRLQSSTSTDADVKEEIYQLKRNPSSKESIGNNNSSFEAIRTPSLKNTDGVLDVEPGNISQNIENLDEYERLMIQERKASNDSEFSVLNHPKISNCSHYRVKHEAAVDAAKATTKAATRLAYSTLIVNVSLMIAKAVASFLSGSLSILSSLVDSCVDITSGLVISISARMIKKRDPYLYPRGRTRLEPLSLVIISVVMGVASVQLIFGAISRIAAAYQYHVHGRGEEPTLDVSAVTVSIMVATVAVKLTLFCICQKFKSDPSIVVLAMDHRNDCLSNTVALACAWLGKMYWYYLDPIGAILVSAYILYTWVHTGWDHLSKLSGRSANPEFINRIIKVCIDHDSRISHLDTVYVYHFGTKFLVEVHIVLDEEMPLKIAHDISEALQINIESLPEPVYLFFWNYNVVGVSHRDYINGDYLSQQNKLVKCKTFLTFSYDYSSFIIFVILPWNKYFTSNYTVVFSYFVRIFRPNYF
ncbi:cation diffusion facilitator family transporter [Dictyocaulus viviparus]|uniref:Cation diffusion facilitator family transporter n=1 Tax=Dictyocaulus viviparus TaxID=29172 RepID=A0A0D8XGQ9_DICVI|nr:cation diffusion facilitator family transporter [Dictyocaulus viviparus]